MITTQLLPLTQLNGVFFSDDAYQSRAETMAEHSLNGLPFCLNLFYRLTRNRKICVRAALLGIWLYWDAI